ncbi:DciA family protein [Streptomyces sp. NPDC002073]
MERPYGPPGPVRARSIKSPHPRARTPAVGGSLVDEWPAIATDLAGHVTLVDYDAATGELAVRPVSSPYATAVRLRTPQLIDAANRVMRSAVVRTIRILPPGAIAGTLPRTGAAPGTRARRPRPCLKNTTKPPPGTARPSLPTARRSLSGLWTRRFRQLPLGRFVTQHASLRLPSRTARPRWLACVSRPTASARGARRTRSL